MASLLDVPDELLSNIYCLLPDPKDRRALRTCHPSIYSSPAVNANITTCTLEDTRPVSESVAALAAFPKQAKMKKLIVRRHENWSEDHEEQCRPSQSMSALTKVAEHSSTEDATALERLEDVDSLVLEGMDVDLFLPGLMLELFPIFRYSEFDAFFSDESAGEEDTADDECVVPRGSLTLRECNVPRLLLFCLSDDVYVDLGELHIMGGTFFRDDDGWFYDDGEDESGRVFEEVKWLTRLRNLRALTLDADIGQGEINAKPLSELKHLRVLNLGQCTALNLGLFVKECTSLQHLGLSSVVWRPQNPRLTPFISSTLKTLTQSGATFAPDLLLHSSLPSLTALRLDCIHISVLLSGSLFAGKLCEGASDVEQFTQDAVSRLLRGVDAYCAYPLSVGQKFTIGGGMVTEREEYDDEFGGFDEDFFWPSKTCFALIQALSQSSLGASLASVPEVVFQDWNFGNGEGLLAACNLFSNVQVFRCVHCAYDHTSKGLSNIVVNGPPSLRHLELSVDEFFVGDDDDEGGDLPNDVFATCQLARAAGRPFVLQITAPGGKNFMAYSYLQDARLRWEHMVQQDGTEVQQRILLLNLCKTFCPDNSPPRFNEPDWLNRSMVGKEKYFRP